MAWKLNPFTGKFDYHKTGIYELFSDANVTTWLVTHGFMAAAPVVPPATGGIEFEDREGIEWKGTEGIEFEDRET